MDNQTPLQSRLATAKRALEIIEVQAAGFGNLHIPAHLQIELEQKRAEVASLQQLVDKEEAQTNSGLSSKGNVSTAIRIVYKPRNYRLATIAVSLLLIFAALVVFLGINTSALTLLSRIGLVQPRQPQEPNLYNYTSVPVDAATSVPDTATMVPLSVTGSTNVSPTPTLPCINPPPLSTTSPYTDELKAITFSPDSSLLASASKDTVKLWKIEGGILSHTPILILPHTGQLTSVTFSPNSQILASASAEPKVGVKLWDTASGKLLNTFEQPESVNNLAFAPDGKTLALGLSTSSSNDVPVRVVLVSDGSLVHLLREHKGPVYSVAFSPDGKSLVTASKDTTVKLWDLTSSSLVLTSMHTFMHTSEVHTVAFSPDGQIIVSALWERPWTIQLWKIDGTLLHTLAGHEGPVTSVSFGLANSSLLGSGATDHEVRLWDVNTGMPLAKVCNSGSAIASVAFAPNNNLFAAGTGLATPSTPFDREVLIWHLSDLLR